MIHNKRLEYRCLQLLDLQQVAYRLDALYGITDMKYVYLLIATMLLCSCATGYHPYTWNGGYKDKELEPGSYEIYFVGNGPTSIEDVTKFWHQRANELCPSGYDYTYYDNKNKTNQIWVPAGAVAVPIFVSYPEITGIARCVNPLLDKEDITES